MCGLQRWVLKSVLAIVKHPRTTLLICALALVACVVLALARLRINTDEDDLFSPQADYFQNFLKFEKKFPENDALFVVIQPTDPSHIPALGRWTELADRITRRLNGLNKLVQRAESRVPIDELGDYALLFAGRHQLEDSFQAAQTELVPLALLWAQGGSPIQRFLFGLSLRTPDAQQARFAGLLGDDWTKTIQTGKPVVPDLASLSAADPSDLGYDFVPDQTDPTRHLLLIQVYLTPEGESKVDIVREAADATAKDSPEFHVAATGRPALNADEMQTSDTDSTRAEIVALTVVFIGLVMFLRSFWLAAVAEISLAVAIGWTFGWTTIAVGQLNLLSLVFLITLIAIGMDYLVQILSRYRLEAQRYERPAAVWMRVFRHVSAPISTACLGAAGAFFVAVFTDFRGAAELGIIAGGGLLLCLLSGYTVLPAILVLFPPKLAALPAAARYAPTPVKRSATRRLVPAAIWVVILLILLPYTRRAHFNPNLLEMQAQNLESVQLVRKLQTWSAVVISPDLSMLGKVRDAALASPTVAGVESILSAYDNYAWLRQRQDQIPKIQWNKPAPLNAADLPGIAGAARLLATRLESAGFKNDAASLRGFSSSLNDSALTPLSQWQEQFIEQLKKLLARFSPSPLDPRRLPDQLRTHLLSADGNYALYIAPKENLWQREPLGRFVRDIEAKIDAVPGHPPVTGIATEIYHSTGYVQTAFYLATAYALALVLVLVFIDMRSVTHTLLTVSVLGLGLPMLVGLMGFLNINWNFANFFGLPILIGAGHEYGVFMMHRYREAVAHPRRVWTAWDVSDRALLLCAFVTTSSFAFFWALGHHEGLKSLGLVMAMGTACIYLAAVLVVRPLLKWKIERAGH